MVLHAVLSCGGEARRARVCGALEVSQDPEEPQPAASVPTGWAACRAAAARDEADQTLGSAHAIHDGDHADNSAPYSGAVYVFTRDASGVWTQQAYIKD